MHSGEKLETSIALIPYLILLTGAKPHGSEEEELVIIFCFGSQEFCIYSG